MLVSRIRTGAAAAVFALWLSACGGGDGSSVVSGTVRDHNQAAVANAEVLAVDRLTGREFSTLSDKDGRYSLVLPNGHYDFGSDDSQHKAAHMVTLRTLSDSDTTVDFALPADQDAAQLSGRVFIRPGIPAANHRLVFSSNHHVSDEDPSLSMETTTDAQGRYTVSLGAQRLLDVDIYDPNGEFVEFVVLHKLDGALRADITLGDASDDNRHRHDASADATNTSNIAAAADHGGSNDFNMVLEFERYSYSEGAKRGVCNTYHFDGGNLPVDGSYLQLVPSAPIEAYDRDLDQVISRPPTEATLNELLRSMLVLRQVSPAILDVSVRNDGKLWFDHAIHFNIARGSTDRYAFTDESGDTFYKSATKAGYYKLSYNSEQPSIRHIRLPQICRDID